MIVITTNNGKSHLERLLNELNNLDLLKTLLQKHALHQLFFQDVDASRHGQHIFREVHDFS